MKIYLMALLGIHTFILSMHSTERLERPIWERTLLTAAWSNHLAAYPSIANSISQVGFIKSKRCKYLGVITLLDLALKKLQSDPHSVCAAQLITIIKEAQKNDYLNAKEFWNILATYKERVREAIAEGSVHIVRIMVPLFMINAKKTNTDHIECFVSEYISSYEELKKKGKESAIFERLHTTARLNQLNIMQLRFEDEKTILHKTALEHPQCLKTLLQFATSKDLQIKDAYNTTPLKHAQIYLAACNGKEEQELRKKLRSSITFLKKAKALLTPHP